MQLPHWSLRNESVTFSYVTSPLYFRYIFNIRISRIYNINYICNNNNNNNKSVFQAPFRETPQGSCTLSIIAKQSNEIMLDQQKYKIKISFQDTTVCVTLCVLYILYIYTHIHTYTYI